MLTLVLGGARSGKSRYARSLCDRETNVVFIATALALGPEQDREMAARIERHRAERPPHWKTVEAPVSVTVAVLEAPRESPIVIDCVTLWISNLLYELRHIDRERRERQVLDAVRSLAEAARDRNVIAVSNEVGEGIVPESPIAREFRDLHGQANQLLAAEASRVVLLVAGIPLDLKAPGK